MPSAAVQLDLFGEVEKAEQAARDREQARADWLARFERADWIAPWDTASGTPKGARVPGWRCPDPECGEIEPGETAYHLEINHGWNPHIPGREPFDGRCHKVRMRQAREAREAAAAIPFDRLTEEISGISGELAELRGPLDAIRTEVADLRAAVQKAARR